MPRAPRTQADPDAAALKGLDDLPADPAPAAPKRRGRPPGSGNKNASIPARRSNGTIMSQAEMIDAVKGQVMMIVLPLAAAWEMRDPECASVLSEEVTPKGDTRLEAIVDRLMVMVARQPSVLAFMAKNTLLLDLGMMSTLLMPIIKQVWKAHGPTGTGHGIDEQEQASAYDRAYPAYQPQPASAGGVPAFTG